MPVANLGVLANAANEVKSSVKFEDTGHLNVVVETGVMQGGVGLELIRRDLFHQAHAAAPDDGAVFDARGHEQPSLTIEGAEVRISEADPLASFGEGGLVVIGARLKGEATVGIDQRSDGVGLLRLARFAGFSDGFGVARAASVRPLYWYFLPRIEIVADGESEPLNAAALLAGEAGVKHAPATGLMRVGGDVHGPQHEVVPGARIADEERVLHPSPVDAVGAHRMGDEIVIGQDEVEEVVEPLMEENIHIANGFAATVSLGEHGLEVFRFTRTCNCYLCAK